MLSITNNGASAKYKKQYSSFMVSELPYQSLFGKHSHTTTSIVSPSNITNIPTLPYIHTHSSNDEPCVQDIQQPAAIDEVCQPVCDSPTSSIQSLQSVSTSPPQSTPEIHLEVNLLVSTN